MFVCVVRDTLFVFVCVWLLCVLCCVCGVLFNLHVRVLFSGFHVCVVVVV